MSRTLYMTIQLLFTLVTTFSYSTLAIAQINGLKFGDRVKITAPAIQQDPIVGNIRWFLPSGILIRLKDSTLVIPSESIQKLSVTDDKWGKIRRGSTIVGIAGAVTMGLIAETGNKNCKGFFCLEDGWAFAMGAMVGGFIGAGIGTLIGATILPERWEEVPVSVSMGLNPYRKALSVNYGISVRLSL